MASLLVSPSPLSNTFYSLDLKFNIIFSALQTLLPDFFRSHLLGKRTFSYSQSNSQKYTPPSPETVDYLAEMLTAAGEKEFYDFATELFWKRIACLRQR